MKSNKLIYIFLLIAIIICVLGIGIVAFLKSYEQNNYIEEYVPQEEITDEQMRDTIVSLYFLDNESQELSVESRVISAVELIQNPYYTLVQLLIEGPKNSNLTSLISEKAILYSAELENNCVILNFSSEFLEYNEDEIIKNKRIYSILNTLAELTEVDSVRFLIEGEKSLEFDEVYLVENN